MSRKLTREASLVKGLDGLGDVGSVEGHLVLGTEGIDFGLAPVGDSSVLLVKVLFETRKSRQIELGSGQSVTQVAHPVTATTAAATVATTVAATTASTIAATTTTASAVAAAAVTRLVTAKTKGMKGGLLDSFSLTVVILLWVLLADYYFVVL